MPLKITFTYNDTTDTTKMTINDDDLFPITKLDFLNDITLLIDELRAKSKIQFIDNSKVLDLKAVDKMKL